MTASGTSRWHRIHRVLAVARKVSIPGSRKFLSAGWDFILPPACVSCGVELSSQSHELNLQILPVSHESVDDINEHAKLGIHSRGRHQCYLCLECRQTFLELIAKPSCQRCGAPIGPYVDSRNGCQECSRDRFAFHHVYRLGIYANDLMRDAVLKGKYLGGEPLLMSLAILIWECYGTAFRDDQIDLIVPIPQHWWQRLWRRHHAPDVLAEALGRCLQVPVSLPILSKRKWTLKQAKLSRADRKKNQQDVFRVTRPSQVIGKTILLVDDVLTTGATADSAARALKAAGARKIVVAVIARVLGNH